MIENKIIVSYKCIFIWVPYIHCFPGYMMNRHALDISVRISAGISRGFPGGGDSCELFEHAPLLKSSTSLSWILFKLLIVWRVLYFFNIIMLLMKYK